ncbi:MAG TPA: 16S rRNA (cytosine(967)-C(5))-methyltransferase RsmB [Geminicoccaceae bacterium]|nr:16S rRNA (cytosine(967)-C(5))-methyltransferase RsmB [Geminicoccaceae bacterium]
MTTRAGASRATLAEELRSAARALERLAEGAALPAALEAVSSRPRLPPASRAAVRDIASRTVRAWGLCRELSTRLNQRPPSPAMLALQQVTLAQLLDPVRPDATTVDQAIEAAKADPALRHGAGFLNATLRRFLRERESLVAAAREEPVGRWNFPAWWIDTLRDAYPDRWQAILEESNREPPLSLRVNTRRISTQAWLASLAEAGIAGVRIGPQAVRLDVPVPLESLPGWGEGLVSVQDAGAQLAAPLLDVADGMRVLDACAAPGGKTTHLLELATLDLVALDTDSTRLARVGENLARLGQQARLVVGDALEPAAWHDGAAFDRILVDAPCTASGIVRRQPDVRWRRRRSDMATFSDRQAAMLGALWPLLAPGGKLLYSTCSVFPAEGDPVVARFMRSHPDALRLPLVWAFAPGGGSESVSQLVPTSEAMRDHDGFYYAMLGKPD